MNAKTTSNNVKTLEELRNEQSKTHWARLIAEGIKADKTAKPASKK